MIKAKLNVKFERERVNGAQKLENKNLFIFSQKIFFICFLVFVFGLGFGAKASAANWYVSQNGAGTKNGTSPSNAWQATNASSAAPLCTVAGCISWSSMTAGDTLYVIGPLHNITSFPVGTGGAINNYFAIEGYDNSSGIVLGVERSSGWSGPDVYGAYNQSYTATISGVIEWTATPLEYTKLNNRGKVPDGDWQNGDYYYDTTNHLIYYKPSGGVITGKTVTFEAQIRLAVDGYDWVKLEDLNFVLTRISVGRTAASQHFWINNCSIKNAYSGIEINFNRNIAPGSDNGRISNCTISDINGTAGIYLMSSNTSYNNDNWLIDHNIITNIHTGSDSHGIGIQAGENNVFEYNEISYANTGFTFWNGDNTIMSDNIARYNFIHNMEGSRGDGRGEGIGWEGANTNSANMTGNYVYNNIVNSCTTSITNGGGIRPKFINSGNYIYNNIVRNCEPNYYFQGVNASYPIGGVMKNNISYNPSSYHWEIATYNNGVYSGLTYDNNLYYPDGGSKFKFKDITNNFSSWKSALTSDSVSGADAASQIGDPLFTNSSGSYSLDTDFQLYWNSPAIDAGTNVSLTADYASNPIYGLPDIGAYEYQPPYTMGSNEVDIAADVRVYGDGKFRNTETVGGTTADLSVDPASNDISQYLDIEISTWETSEDHEKQWTESSDTIVGNTIHIVGDLEAGKYYNVTADSSIAGLSSATCDSVDSNFVCQADQNGQISFTWTGGYSTHTFNVSEGDNLDPTVTNETSAKFHTDTTSVTLSLTTSENSTCKYSTENTTYDNMTSFTTTNETSHSTVVNNLTPGNYTYYAICRDGVGNNTSYTMSFEIAAQEDETDINDVKLKKDNTSKKLNDDKKIYYDQKETRFKGEDFTIADGTVKIYKEGKKITTVDVEGDGKWSKKITFGHNKNYTLKLKFYDQYGTLKDTKEYAIKIDTENPVFEKPFSVSQSIARNDQIIFTATDDDSGLDGYKVKLMDENGRIVRSWRNQDGDWYKIPEAIENGTHILIVRAYDKAGNYAEEQTVLNVGNSTNSSQASQNQADYQNTASAVQADSITSDSCNYTVQSGDTLWNIAKLVYGNSTQYQKIIELNKKKYPDIETKLGIGQELAFDCKNNADNNTYLNTDTANQQVQGAQNQVPDPQKNSPPVGEFKWYNPFSWF